MVFKYKANIPEEEFNRRVSRLNVGDHKGHLHVERDIKDDTTENEKPKRISCNEKLSSQFSIYEHIIDDSADMDVRVGYDKKNGVIFISTARLGEQDKKTYERKVRRIKEMVELISKELELEPLEEDFFSEYDDYYNPNW